MTTIDKAPAPARSTGSATLAIGLLSIPISFYAGVEASGVKRTEYVAMADGTYAKVGRVCAVKLDDDTYGSLVDYADIVKRYECGDGTLVELSDAEISAACDLPDGIADVECFQPLSVLNAGAYVPCNIMQVRAKGQKGKSANGSERALALLLETMKRQRVFALVRFVQRGALHYGALLPNGRFLVLHFDDEIRADRDLPAYEFSEDEFSLAAALIAANMDKSARALVNDAAERVRAYAETKAGAGERPVPVTAAPSQAGVSSLMDTLRASVAAAKGGAQ